MRRGLVLKTKWVDSFDVEAMDVPGVHKGHDKDLSLGRTLDLAFQTLGVVYGDMGTNSLYVFTSVFIQARTKGEEDVLGALALVMYTIALIPLAK